MLISDYAGVFFFARWNRVTLQRSAMHRTERSCNFKTEPDQRPPSSADAISECARANRNAMGSCSQLDTVKIRSRKNTVRQKYSHAKIRERRILQAKIRGLQYGVEQP